MKPSVLCLLILMLLATLAVLADDRRASVLDEAQFDQYGGWREIKGKATGFFHVEQIDGKWWFITPEGNGFLSIGVNFVSFQGDFAPALGYAPYERNMRKKYGDRNKWIVATLSRLKAWGFNTIGGFSLPVYHRRSDELAMPYTISFALGDLGGADWQKGIFPDVFNPVFKDKVMSAVQRVCIKTRQDPFLIGYFLDNELHWNNAITSMLRLPDNVPGKKAILQFIKEYYEDDFNKFRSVWETTATDFDTLSRTRSIKPRKGSFEKAREAQDELLRFISQQYFEITVNAIRSCDKNHLILGVRLLPVTPRAVVEEFGKYADVIAVNFYANRDEDKTKEYINWIERQAEGGMVVADKEWLRGFAELSKGPILITEFSFKAKDSGLPNTKGGGLETRVFKTQRDRAAMFEWYAKKSAGRVYIVGYHWYQYMDQPKEGRFDGENSNLGLVDIQDNPYDQLIERVKVVNREVYLVHKDSN